MKQRSEFEALMRNAGLDMLKEYDAKDIYKGGYKDGKYPDGSEPKGYDKDGNYPDGSKPKGYIDTLSHEEQHGLVRLPADDPVTEAHDEPEKWSDIEMSPPEEWLGNILTALGISSDDKLPTAKADEQADEQVDEDHTDSWQDRYMPFFSFPHSRQTKARDAMAKALERSSRNPFQKKPVERTPQAKQDGPLEWIQKYGKEAAQDMMRTLSTGKKTWDDYTDSAPIKEDEQIDEDWWDDLTSNFSAPKEEETVDYDAVNLSRYRRAMRDGNLGNVGPVGPDGTSFSPDRWDKYAQMADDQDVDDANYYVDEIGAEMPDDEYYAPIPSDDTDPDAEYEAAKQAQAHRQAQARADDIQADKRTEWDVRRADDQFDNLDAEYDADYDLDQQAKAQARADAKAAKLAQVRAKKTGSKVKPQMDTAPADVDLSPDQLDTRRKVQDKYGLDKTKAVQDLSAIDGDQQDELIRAVNKPKAGVGVPGVSGSSISGNATMADPTVTKGAQNTDDFGYDLDADSNFAGQTRSPEGMEKQRALRNKQLNRNAGMGWDESVENNAEVMTEMDRMLRIAGLR